ncbi:cytochrome oxidase putative small subunit CydP [Piscinibacter sakaiensis]|uniref:Uncharacterized protein n=2 Tax=Piscinibacter sakaiensis TaxID=1547922 RepID=A0A0K8P2A3_PISS1|nr:cytochrome oxidase putative small subunit CydP [Piscinibacter sakaiensis]GAP36756.1 hypothetical protein ISF6_2596 [Piscinibacter sakaiensis]
MTLVTNRLVRHLALAVALKLLLLSTLWWAFVRDERVGVDADRAAAHLGVTADTSPSPTASDGARP